MKQVPYRYRKPKLNNFGSAILVPVPVRNVNEQNSFSPEECVQSVVSAQILGEKSAARASAGQVAKEWTRLLSSWTTGIVYQLPGSNFSLRVGLSDSFGYLAGRTSDCHPAPPPPCRRRRNPTPAASRTSWPGGRGAGGRPSPRRRRRRAGSTSAPRSSTSGTRPRAALGSAPTWRGKR